MRKAITYLIVLAVGLTGFIFLELAPGGLSPAMAGPGGKGCTKTLDPLARLKSGNLFQETFNNNDCAWIIKHPEYVHMKGGELVASSPGNTRNKAELPLNLSVFNDFEIEVTVKWKSGNKGSGNGFEYISCSKERKDFTINAQGSLSASTYHVDARKYVDEIPWAPNPGVKQGTKVNKIKVRKEAGYTTFFVNGKEVGKTKFGTNCDIFNITLFTDSHTAHYDDLKINVFRWNE